MFEKLMQVAEHAATGVSRREFFGRFGRGAMAVAAAAGGLAASASAGSQAVCAANSSAQCAGKPVGSRCFADFRVRGHCDLAPACVCVADKPHHGA